jgi:KTSC domain
MSRLEHDFRQSTRIVRGWYDESAQTVELEFRRDHVHVVYRNVPLSVWQDLEAAPSPGRFVTEVLEQYSYRRR